MVIKSVYAPYRKRLECKCDSYTHRSKKSRKRGMYRVYEGGHYKEKVFNMRSLSLLCLSCGLEKSFNLEVKTK
jgi:hypothetical protein